MNLDDLYAEAERRADGKFDEILIRLLTADMPELLPDPSGPCAKCTHLVVGYIRAKLALHRYKRRVDDDYGTRWAGWSRPCEINGSMAGGVWLLEARVEQAKSAFHTAKCECGQLLWKGRKWHTRQAELRMKALLEKPTPSADTWVDTGGWSELLD